MKTKLTLTALFAMMPFAASAYDLPGVNLGGTSFYDSAPPPQGSGLYLIEYLQFTQANRLNGPDGESLGLPNEDLDVFVPLTQLFYMSDYRIGSARLGVAAFLPYLDADMDDGAGGAALDTNSGVGDVMFGAVLQFDPIMGEKGPKFSQRIELDVSLPTGDYDSDKSINPGNNAVFINPYYAMTYWITPRWTVSSRFYYLWNGKNDDPSAYQQLNANETQAGDAVHINFASAYAVNDKLSVGINGYALKQLSDTEVNGQEVSDTKEKVWAIGPGLFYAFGKNDSLHANYYMEHDAENRSEGDRFVLRFNHHF